MLFWKLFMILSFCSISVWCDFCTRTVTKSKFSTLFKKTIHFTSIEHECCPGYSLVNQQCEPICQDCPDGKCIAPDTCKCNAGYELDSQHKCQPICKTGCSHGKCIAPNKCQCNDQYAMSEDDICEAICAKGCVNGECIEPDICKCLEGYSNVSANLCMPVCASGCPNGKCVAPEICECNHGYAIQDNKCQPICLDKCINAVCRAPNKCECKPGYYKTSNDSCSEAVTQAAVKISKPTKTRYIVVCLVIFVILVFCVLAIIYWKFGVLSCNLRELGNKFRGRNNPHTQLNNDEMYNEVHLL